MPNLDRRYDHSKADGAAGEVEQASYEVTTPLPNLFSNSAPKQRSADSDAEAAEKAAGASEEKSSK